ncbi:site-specific integrase [Mucilaginibacter sp. UR6-1]|uniref:site-specific integrase n=1 Tax=Mucilaginibacter sp. UR6-1 TaxID=1435643 RepID=UPI001E28E6EB|nr:site-specific integrase [Mucilaginibacter sp. UR6-1]MCC8410758.1 site-specific integrase [Mucilaginibacter sp. UR6-1]
MATVSAKILKHHKKTDGTFNVKICISHQRERSFIDTEFYVTEKQLKKDRSIKDQFVLTCVNKSLDAYRRAICDNDELIGRMTASDIKDFLLKRDKKIDFLDFSDQHIKLLIENEQGKSAANFKTVRNHIIDFIKRPSGLPIEQITTDFLEKFEAFLRGPRIMTRMDRLGRPYKAKGKPLGDASVHVYLRDFSGLFSAAIDFHNRPSIGLTPIKTNPFSDYAIVDAPETQKRNIDAEKILTIKNSQPRANSRCEMAKDLFMLSFYLCGINAIDLYKANYRIKNGRIEYNRSKTQDRRKDGAFISIKIPKEAVRLLSRYDGVLNQRYASIGNLNKAISIGMRELQVLTGVPEITFYWARHSFGTLARNNCRMSKDDIALALNHVDNGHKTTDIYLAKDWSIVDEVQEAVLNLLKPKNVKRNCNPPERFSILTGIVLPKII